MGLNVTVRGNFDSLIEIYCPVPSLAYLPLMVIWFSIDETSKILLICLAIFAAVTLSTVAGVRSVVQVRMRTARTLGVGWSMLVAAEPIMCNWLGRWLTASFSRFIKRCLSIRCFFRYQPITPLQQRDLSGRFGVMHILPMYPHTTDAKESIERDTNVTFIEIRRRRHSVGQQHRSLRGAVIPPLKRCWPGYRPSTTSLSHFRNTNIAAVRKSTNVGSWWCIMRRATIVADAVKIVCTEP